MSRFSLRALDQELREAFGPACRYSDQVARALVFAFEAHDGQFRENRQEGAPPVPYIAHPVGVAKQALRLLPYATLPDTLDDVISVCLTHDVLEDSNTSLLRLRKEISERTADLVVALTKPALAEFGSRAERDKAFVKQIAEAGPTAKFVKVCDAIHNLSRPGSMPNDLLTKTLRRALNDYLPLCEDERFDERIRTALQEQIRDAEAVVSHDREALNGRSYSNFESALAYGMARGRGKILEEHDIVQILELVGHGAWGAIATSEDYISAYLESYVDADGKQRRQQIRARLEEGDCSLSSGLLKADALSRLPVDRIISCPFPSHGRLMSPRRAFIAVGSLSPSWLNTHTMTALVSVLSERLRVREARELSVLSIEIANMNLGLDPELAQTARLTGRDLVRLKAILESADYVHRNLYSLINGRLRESAFKGYVDRMESRIKDANSIVQKLIRRQIREIPELDDIVGIRIVALSKSMVEGLSRELAGYLLEEGNESIFMNILKDSVSASDVRSIAGYSSRHLRLRVAGPSNVSGAIGCEIQIRTLFEDSWARASHMLSYKKELHQDRKAKISELAVLRDSCERILDQLE